MLSVYYSRLPQLFKRTFDRVKELKTLRFGKGVPSGCCQCSSYVLSFERVLLLLVEAILQLVPAFATVIWYLLAINNQADPECDSAARLEVLNAFAAAVAMRMQCRTVLA
jgi:hypothetical protein